jgi:hypothetical protein
MEPGTTTQAEAIAFLICFVGIAWIYWCIAVLLLLEWLGLIPPAPPLEEE